MLLAAFNVMRIVKGAILGAIILLVLRSISIQDAYESISWSVIFLIASLIPLGIAIQKTELDKDLGNLIIILGSLFSEAGIVSPIVILTILYGFSFMFTTAPDFPLFLWSAKKL